MKQDLILEGGKTFIVSEIVMLDAKIQDASEKFTGIYKAREDIGWIRKNAVYHITNINGQIVELNGHISMGYHDFMSIVQCKHLYFLSDEEIKEGDWYMYRRGYGFPDELIQANGLLGFDTLVKSQCFKIIATTDPKIGHYTELREYDYDPRSKTGGWKAWPRPSNSFLQKYCELDGIDKVLVESDLDDFKFMSTLCTTKERNYKLKVAPDNTITIKPYKVKDSYTEDQVIKFAMNMISQYKFGNTNIENPEVLRESLKSNLWQKL